MYDILIQNYKLLKIFRFSTVFILWLATRFKELRNHLFKFVYCMIWENALADIKLPINMAPILLALKGLRKQNVNKNS